MKTSSILHLAPARSVAYLFLCAALAAAASLSARAQEPSGPIKARLLALPEVTHWLERHMSPAERAALRHQDLKVSGAQCGCFDQPQPHYPYTVVIVSSPKSDLVARVEGQEGALWMKPLAQRTGTLYCSIEDGESCFGEFAQLCDFTDARFGPALAPYFPDCKS